MGSFANTLFRILLGWLQGLVSMIWSALTAKDGKSFLSFIGENWLLITLILCATGLIADFAVYLFRWKPYKVWQTFLRHLQGKLDERDPEKDVVPDLYRDMKNISQNPEEDFYTESVCPFRPDTEKSVRADTGTQDELERWRTSGTADEESAVPAEITKAGYTVPADSPYRRPAERNRRRRLRVSLLGEAENDGEVHFYAPRPIVDQKEAYHAPVYPEKWTGSREQDS